jgi:hypothetical protein
LRPIAEDIAVTKNLIITLAKFEHRTDLEIFPASDKETLDAQ